MNRRAALHAFFTAPNSPPAAWFGRSATTWAKGLAPEKVSRNRRLL
ncbi:hypothetical protein [Streptomyces sp. NPDC058394]